MIGIAMQVSVTHAKGQLTDLVRRVEAGDEVILTRHGQAVARLIPIKAPRTLMERKRILETANASGTVKAMAGESAARSQDFLYDGIPK
jgi:prevent-host-death family protein